MARLICMWQYGLRKEVPWGAIDSLSRVPGEMWNVIAILPHREAWKGYSCSSIIPLCGHSSAYLFTSHIDTCLVTYSLIRLSTALPFVTRSNTGRSTTHGTASQYIIPLQPIPCIVRMQEVSSLREMALFCDRTNLWDQSIIHNASCISLSQNNP